MRKFQITVNGTAYEVEVEEIGAGASVVPAAVTAAPAATPAPKAAPKAAPAAEGSVKVNAPMPGNINAVKVSVGQSVKAGDVLLILEAMKMENEIKAPQDGTVASIAVNKGQSVNTGDLMISLK